MTAYSSHVALVRHLTYSKTCRLALVQRKALVEDQPSINSRHELQHRPTLWDPHFRAAGPLYEERFLPTPYDDFTEPQFQLLYALRQMVLDYPRPCDEEQYEFLLKGILIQTTLHQSEIEAVLFGWWQTELAAIAFAGWADAVLDISSKLCASFFFQAPEKEHAHIFDVSFIDSWLLDVPPLQVVQRPLKYRPVLMGHLFSGRRRENDLQHC